VAESNRLLFDEKVAAALVLVLAAAPLWAENFVKVEVDGRSLVLDTDSDAVQRNLKPANPKAGEVKLPAWLFPTPGQTPLRANYDARTGIASASFASGGTVDQVIAYYQQLFASKGYITGTPLGSPTSKIMSGKNASAVISVSAGVPSRSPAGGAEFTVTYAPAQNAANRKHFEAAWFDQARALLCLRDVATGEEYYLDARGIGAANLNRPGAVKSEGAPYPDWFPIYPGAQRTNFKVFILLEPTATFRTRDSMRAVFDFYVTALKDAGAKVLSQSFSRSGNPPKDFSGEIKAQKGDDVVEIAIGAIIDPIRGMSGEGAGFGVRYTVPMH
jgi:hypothetical protein